MKKMIIIVSILLLTGCASMKNRIFLDSTTHSDSLPSWAKGTTQVWEEDGKVHFHGYQGILGNERITAGLKLASLNAKDAMVTEIASDFRTRVDVAQQSISEDAELVLGQVLTSETSGRITGFRVTDHYYERYILNETERIGCHVLGVISKQNYNKLKSTVFRKIVEVAPVLKEAITNKQIDFFNNN